MPSPFLKNGKLDENSIHNVPLFIGVDSVDAEEEYERIKFYLSRKSVERLSEYLTMMLKKTSTSEEAAAATSPPVPDEEDSKGKADKADEMVEHIVEFSKKTLIALFDILTKVEGYFGYDIKNLKDSLENELRKANT
jgi:ribosomal protein L12E/L44/L45/RPP1/RPP2